MSKSITSKSSLLTAPVQQWLPPGLLFCIYVAHHFHPNSLSHASLFSRLQSNFYKSSSSCIVYTLQCTFVMRLPLYWDEFLCRHYAQSFHVGVQGDHLSGKPGNVGEFDSCQGSVREKILSGKSCLKLFIVSCLFACIQIFSRSLC